MNASDVFAKRIAQNNMGESEVWTKKKVFLYSCGFVIFMFVLCVLAWA